mmetsp:Transcript_4951/g.9453  ORF Transcript_4951/g.9453 Transcript_4951/m.9453 type:complete len:212 (-) Transcript_4951:9-644(-)
MTTPGLTLLTRTPWGARSTDAQRMSMSSAAFDAQYDAVPPNDCRPFTLDTFTMALPDWDLRWGAALSMKERGARAFTAMLKSQVSRAVFAPPCDPTAPPLSTPALFTRMSNFPKASTVFSTTFATSASSVTSPGMATAEPPVPSMADTSSERFSARRPVTATMAPSAANILAVAYPMPLEAPVIKATFCARRLDMTFETLLYYWEEGFDFL